MDLTKAEEGKEYIIKDIVTDDEELNAFLKQIADRDYTPAWDFEKDKAVLDIIDQIEAE